MGRYVVRRLLLAVPVLLGTTFIIYFFVYALSGDPIRALAGDRPLSPSVQAELRDRFNLNDPFVVQYAKYIAGLAQGDFGTTFRLQPVSDIIERALPVTVKLALVAVALEAVIGLVAGILAGVRRGSFLDNLVLVSTTLIVSVPVFVLGYLLQYTFGVQLGWFPVSGLNESAPWYAEVYQLLVPGFVLAAASLAYIARLTRTSLVENLRNDYVRTARAKGLQESRVVGKHAMRNSLIPVITFLGADLGALMSGAIVTEGIFNLGGLGSQVFIAIRGQEGAVVVGISTFFVLVYILANLAVDILYAYLDPRIRYD